jgi:two-component system, cell cycle response regulator DivK
MPRAVSGEILSRGTLMASPDTNQSSVNSAVRTERNADVAGRRAQPLVLLAEDFEDARELYRDYLEFSGFTVHTANNGQEAVQQALMLQPDLILMDASMPVLDGWQATRELKANPATRHIPILALTAHAFNDARQQANAVGCDGFVTKPCLPDELVARVRETLAPPAPLRKKKS